MCLPQIWDCPCPPWTQDHISSPSPNSFVFYKFQHSVTASLLACFLLSPSLPLAKHRVSPSLLPLYSTSFIMKVSNILSMAFMVPAALAQTLPACSADSGTPCSCPAGTVYQQSATFAVIGALGTDVKDLITDCKSIRSILVHPLTDLFAPVM